MCSHTAAVPDNFAPRISEEARGGTLIKRHDVMMSPGPPPFHFILLYNHRALLRYIWARDPPIITKVHDFGTHRELCPNVTLVAIDCSDRGIVASAGAHAAEECSDAQCILSGVD